MTFVRKHLGTEEFLSPAIQTVAIQKLGDYMSNYYRSGYGAWDKQTFVTCFGIPGIGKTTTIREAAKNSNSIIVDINMSDNQLFRQLLDSRKSMGEKQYPPLKSTDLIHVDKVENYFKKNFETIRIHLFQSVIEQMNTIGLTNLNGGLDIITPAKPESPEAGKSLYDTHNKLVQMKRLLVFHVDNCQEFFCSGTNAVQYHDGIWRWILDPNQKFEIIFFAERFESSKAVRVLCRLTTTGLHDSKKLVVSIFKLDDNNVPDYRSILSPKSTMGIPQIHKQIASESDCFEFEPASLGSMLHFSLNLCDKSFTACQALESLLGFEVCFDNKEPTFKRRKRGFQSIDDFYNTLEEISDWEEEDTEIVKRVFVEKEISVMQLSFLTDADEHVVFNEREYIVLGSEKLQR